MAEEIKIRSGIEVTKDSFKFADPNRPTLTFDMDGDGGGNPGVIDVGTSEEDVDLSEFATLGWVWMRNLDDTNYVTWGPKSGASMVALGRLEPGEPAGPFRLEPGITLRMVADTAACKVQVNAFPD